MLTLALCLAGCGESKQAKAEKTVCSARSQIQAKVAGLKTISPSVANLPQIKTEATAIVAELKKIREAQPDLSVARRQQTEEATKAFEAAIRTTVERITPSTSLSAIESQVKIAILALGADFTRAFAPVKCG